jgi:hypothetical protein
MIPSLSLDLTSTLTAVSTVARDLEAMVLKPTIISPKRSITIPRALPVATRTRRIIKRRGGGQ